MSDHPTSPTAAEAPLDEPPSASDPQGALLDEHARVFAKLVATTFDAKLEPVLRHIEREDTERGELLRVLARLSGELGMIRSELRAQRTDAVGLHAKVHALTERVDGIEDRVETLERKP